MNKPLILLIEDQEMCSGHIKRALQEQYEVIISITKEEAIADIKKHQFDIILLDLTLPDSTGTHIIPEINTISQNVPMIIITNDDDPDTAADVIKKGAQDYINKEKFFKNKLILINKIAAILQMVTYKKWNTIQSEQIAYLNRNIFIPDSPDYKSAYMQSEIAFKGRLSLLIYGETGVGKSMLVTSIHQKIMPDKPLVSLDCGGICSNLIESELFGYEKGAFTGADTLKIGKIELANGGILFLDEIGNASMDVQTKLLRVLHEKKICRLGSNKEILVDFMLISATNKDLISAIAKKEFKEDFYYRIKQIEITLPPIRNNHRALKQFVEFYINTYNLKYQTHFQADNEFWDYILAKRWTGNLRELDLDIQKIIFTYSLGQDHRIYMFKEIYTTTDAKDIQKLKINYEEKEKEKIMFILEKNTFNVSATARELDIPRTTLLGRMQKYNIMVEK